MPHVAVHLYNRALLWACGQLNALSPTPKAGALATTVLRPGSLVAERYVLRHLLGHGGMGRVWLADDVRERREVALKEMRGGRGRAERDVAFKQEFFTMSKLGHPGIVAVYDCGVLPGGGRYIVMEPVPGQDASAVLQRDGPLPLGRVCSIVCELAQVLAFIHSRLYVHCDIKSGNVRLLPDGSVKLMDFGLLHQLGAPSGGLLRGTLGTMAPEVPLGRALEAATDFYSLGALAFELIAGRLPYPGDDLAVVRAHIEAPVPSLRRFRDVPAALDAVITRLLAKSPRQRFEQAADLVAALEPWCDRQVTKPTYRARTSYLNAAELVGREAEQAWFAEALASLHGGHGRTVFVCAPAGVGKTRLLGELRLSAKLADLPFVTGTCRAEGQAPLAPLVEALTALVPYTPMALRQAHPTLASVLPGWLPYHAERPPTAALLEALVAWLAALAAQQSFVLVLEDLHWAYPTAVDLFNGLIRGLVDKPCLLVGSLRSDEVDRLSNVFYTVDEGMTHRLELQPLPRPALKQLVTSMLKDVHLNEAFLTRLHAATGGNAFFITETLRAFVEDGTLRVERGAWQLAVPAEQLQLPTSIDAVVAGRLNTLEVSTLQLCRLIAPIGRVLDLDVVKGVAELAEAELFAGLDVLVERQFIQKSDSDFYFTHDRVRQAVYAGTPPEARQRAHLRVAATLQRRDPGNDELLAYHTRLGGDRSRAIRHLQAAARSNLARQQNRRAVELTAAAAEDIEAIDPHNTTQLVQLWRRIIEVGLTAHPPLCVRATDQLLGLWDKQVGLERAARAFNAGALALQGRSGLITRWRLRRLWREPSPQSRSLVAVAVGAQVYRCMQGMCLASMGDTERLEASWQASEREHPHPTILRASGFSFRNAGLLHRGHWDAIEANATAARQLFAAHCARVGQMPQTLWKNYGWALYFDCMAAGHAGRCIDDTVWQQALRLASEHGFGDVRWWLHITRVIAATFSGDPNEMATHYAACGEILKSMGSPLMMEARQPLFSALYYLRRGDVELADAICKKLELLCGMLPYDRRLQRDSLIFRALYHLDVVPEAAAAEAALEGAFATLQPNEPYRLLALMTASRARLALLHGNPAAARAIAERAVQLCTQGPLRAVGDEMNARCTLARALGGAAGVAQARQAFELARRWDKPLQEALALWEVGRLETDTHAARRALSEAAALFERLRCNAHLNNVRRLLQ